MRDLGVSATSAVSAIRVVFLGENRLFCEGLRRMCVGQPSVTVVAETNVAGLREAVRTTSPHILVADVRGDGALTLCRELRKDGVRPWAILVAAEADDEWAVRALEAGARGILANSATAEDLVKAIRVVHEGQIWASKEVIGQIVEELAILSGAFHAAEALLGERLSRREQEIVRHAAGGLSNREIADRLNISEATVKAHMTHVFQKLGVRDRTQLVARYHRTLAPSAPGRALTDSQEGLSGRPLRSR